MKWGMKRILLFEILIVLVFGLFFVYAKKQPQEIIDVSLEEWNSEYIEYQNGVWQIGEDWVKTYGSDIKLLWGPSVKVQKGEYTVTIRYLCDKNQKFLVFADKSNKEYIKAEEAILDRCSQIVSYDFKVAEDVDNLEVLIYYNGEGSLSISDISIVKNDNALHRMLICFMLALLSFNLLILYKRSSQEEKNYLLGILSITFLSSLPVFFYGLNDVNGQDLLFHLMRIEGIAKELQIGNFPVRISSAWLGEYGYPVSIYYGDALLYIPAMLRLFGFTVNVSYKIFIILVNLGTSLAGLLCFKNIFKKQSISLLLVLVYTTSTYRLLNLYQRSAVGECIALMFLPLVVLALYNIYTGKNNTAKGNIKNAILLMVGMTGIITAHVLSAEMVAFVMICVCILYIRRTIRKEAIMTYLIAVGGTLILSAYFVVPFLDYYSSEVVKIKYIVGEGTSRRIQSYGCNIGDYFDFFSNPFAGTNILQYNPGFILMLGFVTILILWLKKKITHDTKMLVILTMVLMFMTTNVFPWDSLAYHSKIFNLLAQVQFPSRYIGIISVLLTLILGIILQNKYLENLFSINSKTLIMVCVAIPIYTTCLFSSYYTDNYKRDVMYYDTANLDSYYVMNGEYLRLGTDYDEFDGRVKADGIEYVNVLSRKGCDMDIECIAGEKGGVIEFPIAYYSGYVISDNYGNEFTAVDSADSYVSVYVPEYYEGILYLRYEEPWYWSASLILSVVSTIGLVSYIGMDLYKKYRGESMTQND